MVPAPSSLVADRKVWKGRCLDVPFVGKLGSVYPRGGGADLLEPVLHQLDLLTLTLQLAFHRSAPKFKIILLKLKISFPRHRQTRLVKLVTSVKRFKRTANEPIPKTKYSKSRPYYLPCVHDPTIDSKFSCRFLRVFSKEDSLDMAKHLVIDSHQTFYRHVPLFPLSNQMYTIQINNAHSTNRLVFFCDPKTLHYSLHRHNIEQNADKLLYKTENHRQGD